MYDCKFSFDCKWQRELHRLNEKLFRCPVCYNEVIRPVLFQKMNENEQFSLQKANVSDWLKNWINRICIFLMERWEKGVDDQQPMWILRIHSFETFTAQWKMLFNKKYEFRLRSIIEFDYFCCFHYWQRGASEHVTPPTFKTQAYKIAVLP